MFELEGVSNSEVIEGYVTLSEATPSLPSVVHTAPVPLRGNDRIISMLGTPELEETMDSLKSINLAVRFLIELCMLAAIGYWGFSTHAGWALKIIFGIGLPILLIVIWGLLLAPRATHRLRGALYILLSLVLLGSGAIALFAAGRAVLGWIYAVILVVNQVLLMVWKQ